MNTSAPLISFIMPAYNVGAYIADAINSIREQTYTNWKLVVVNDCSTDNTLEIVESFVACDSRISVITMNRNSGNAFPPRQKAIELSEGDLIAPLDADDMIEPDYVGKLLAVKTGFGCEVVYPTMYRLDMDGHKGDVIVPVKSFDISKTYSGRDLVAETLLEWRIGANGGLIDKEFYLSCISQVERRDLMNSDEYLTRVILLNAKKVRLCDAKYYYRTNPESITRTVSLKAFDPLISNEMLYRLVADNFMSDSKARKAMELHRFDGLISSINYYNANSANLSEADGRTARELIRKTYSSIDWAATRRAGGWKYWSLFRLGLRPAAFFLKIYGRYFVRKQL